MSIFFIRKIFYKFIFLFLALPVYSQIIPPDILEQFESLQQLGQNNSQELSNIDNQSNILAPQESEIDIEEDFISLKTLSFGTLELQNFGYDIFKAVSYTHLTLPTIYSV